jgi:serine/threonine protein kinase
MLFLGNLLLTKDRNHVKLAGFEVARDNICDEMTCEAGTYRYMAPEVYIYIHFFFFFFFFLFIFFFNFYCYIF